MISTFAGYTIAAMAEVLVSMNDLDPKYSMCKVCPAFYLPEKEFPWLAVLSVCRIARLEKSLGRIPTYKDVAKIEIDANLIPENCPNGYISLSSREIREAP